MQRIVCPERDDWRATAESAGFDFHTIDGERYWDERAYYAFTLDEIERRIEGPTGEIEAMCFELVGRTVKDEKYLRRLKIPEAFWPLISESWHRDDASLYGRLDLSFDGRNLYLSQWYKQRILKLDENGNILQVIEVGAEICGHVFVDGLIYVLRGVEKPNEDWRIARLDPREETPKVEDLAHVPFACRSLTFDGQYFWTNHRAANETVSFERP